MSANDDDSSTSSSYEPTYAAETIEIIPPYSYQVMMVEPPPLEYMCTLHSQQKEISGRKVWCGSLVCALALIERKNTLKGLDILELGSGTGILGMLAHQLGANSVALTDGDPVSIDLIKENLTLNNMEEERIKTTRLLWGDNKENERFHSWYQDTFCNNNSGSDHDDEDNNTITFDMIVAGDVMYKSSLPELFFQTVMHYLKKETGILYLCHVPRANVTQDIVVKQAKDSGLKVEIIEVCGLEQWMDDGGGEYCEKEDVSRAKVYKMMRRK